jgi:hypothetical protein
MSVARPVPAPEPTVKSVTVPKAPKNSADAKHKAAAASLYRALQRRADAGLSWRECWLVLDEHGHEEVQVGPVIIWMRARGVAVLSLYRAGETVFVLEVMGASAEPVTALSSEGDRTGTELSGEPNA